MMIEWIKNNYLMVTFLFLGLSEIIRINQFEFNKFYSSLDERNLGYIDSDAF